MGAYGILEESCTQDHPSQRMMLDMWSVGGAWHLHMQDAALQRRQAQRDYPTLQIGKPEHEKSNSTSKEQSPDLNPNSLCQSSDSVIG